MIPITELREELIDAQLKDPRLQELIFYLRGKKLGDILSDPRRDGARLKVCALGFCLDKRDGLLRKVDVPELDPEDAVPVVPAALP